MAVKFTKPEINVREKLAELDKPSGIAGESMLRAETPQEQFNLISAGRRRMNHNGDMRVWQRGVTAANPSTAFTHLYGSDRHLIQTQDMGTVTTTIDTDVPAVGGFTRSTKIACTATGTSTDDSNLIFIHRIEGQDSQCTNFGTSNPESLTLSFWIKSNKAGAFNVNFENEDTSVVTGGSSADQGYQTKEHIHCADTWEYKTVTIDGDPYSPFAFNVNKGLCFDIALSNSGQTSGTATYDRGTPSAKWSLLNNNQRSAHNQYYFASSTSNYYKITGVQLELGKVATPFEHRSYGEELALCQRYYYQIGRVGGPVTTLSSGSMYSATVVNLYVPFPVPMRSTPAVSRTVNGTGNWLNLYIGATGHNSNTNPTVGDSGTDSMRIYCTGAHSGNSPSAAGAGVWAMVLAGASLNFSADL